MDIYKCYAGIGSRETPLLHQGDMERIASILNKENWTLRSGGALGADSAFERGARGKAEIYLPWRNYNNNPSQYYKVCDKAMEIAQKHHPVWDKLSNGARLLMGRNVYQILGKDLDNPSRFVLCYTLDGCEGSSKRTARTGGTGQAIAIASEYNIPVFNFSNGDWLDRLNLFLER